MEKWRKTLTLIVMSFCHHLMKIVVPNLYNYTFQLIKYTPTSKSGNPEQVHDVNDLL